MKYLKGAWFLSTAIIMTCLCFSLICLARLISLMRFPLDHPAFAHRIAGFWGRSMFYLTPGWKIRVFGRENLADPSKAVVYISNHQSNADIWAVYFLKRRFSWLSKAEVFKVPLVGQSMRWARYIPIHRGNKSSHLKALDDSMTLLREGVSMFFFPEGTRSKDKRMKEFKPGAFKLAKDAKVNLQPLILKGTGDLLEKGSYIPSSYAEVEIHILPIIETNGKTVHELEAEAFTLMSEAYKRISPDYA